MTTLPAADGFGFDRRTYPRLAVRTKSSAARSLPGREGQGGPTMVATVRSSHCG